MARQCELMNDTDRLRELWPMMLRGLGSIKKMKEKAKAMGPDYIARELFPPSFLDGGISGEFPELTTPMWVLFGCKAATRAGKRLGLPDWERFEELFNEVMNGVRRYAKEHTKKTESGIPYIPMNIKEREYDNPQSATWAFHHAIYPREVFPPDDPLVENLLKLMDDVDNTQGLPEETGWIHDQGLWMYDGLFCAQNWLYAGNPEKAVDYLYACADHAAPSRVWREEQTFNNSRSAEFCGDMPHNWGSAEFIRLARNLIILEKGENLELLPGLPEEWLPQKKGAENGLVIEESPTRFGRVTVDLQLIGDEEEPTGTKTSSGGRFVLTFSRSEGQEKPREVVLHWDGEVIGGDGRITKKSDGIWTVGPDATEFEVELKV